jgi:hypothetical protein
MYVQWGGVGVGERGEGCAGGEVDAEGRVSAHASDKCGQAHPAVRRTPVCVQYVLGV